MKLKLVQSSVICVLLLLIVTSCSSSKDLKGTWISGNGLLVLTVTNQTINLNINQSNPGQQYLLKTNPQQGKENLKMWKDMNGKYKILAGNKLEISDLNPNIPGLPSGVYAFKISGNKLTFTEENSPFSDPSFNPWTRSKP